MDSIPEQHESLLGRPFLRWIGGRQRLVAQLKSLMPDQKPKRYFEPFLGGGSLFFAHGFAQSELSDLNPYLINAYRFVKEDPAQVHINLSTHAASLNTKGKPYYLEQRELFSAQNLESVHLEEQAARFIFLIHSNFNGIYRVNAKGVYNVPFGGNTTPFIPGLDLLKAASARLQGANLYHRSYEEIVEELEPGDLVYLDPPCPTLNQSANFTGYATQRFSEIEQRELAVHAHRMVERGANVMISIAEVDLIDKLYPQDRWVHNVARLNGNVSTKRSAIAVTEIILTCRPS